MQGGGQLFPPAWRCRPYVGDQAAASSGGDCWCWLEGHRARLTAALRSRSISRLELVLAFEEQFDVKVNKSELGGVATIGQAFDLVTSKL